MCIQLVWHVMHHLLLLLLLMVSMCHTPLTLLVRVHVLRLLCMLYLLRPATLLLLLPPWLIGLWWSLKVGICIPWVPSICMQQTT